MDDLTVADGVNVPAAWIFGYVFGKVFPKRRKFIVHVNSLVIPIVSTAIQAIALGSKPIPAFVKAIAGTILATGGYEMAEPALKR